MHGLGSTQTTNMSGVPSGAGQLLVPLLPYPRSRTCQSRLRRGILKSPADQLTPGSASTASTPTNPATHQPVPSIKRQLQHELEGTRRGIFGIKASSQSDFALVDSLLAAHQRHISSQLLWDLQLLYRLPKPKPLKTCFMHWKSKVW